MGGNGNRSRSHGHSRWYRPVPWSSCVQWNCVWENQRYNASIACSSSSENGSWYPSLATHNCQTWRSQIPIWLNNIILSDISREWNLFQDRKLHIWWTKGSLFTWSSFMKKYSFIVWFVDHDDQNDQEFTSSAARDCRRQVENPSVRSLKKVFIRMRNYVCRVSLIDLRV
jgi:hypothetical protein